MGQPAPWIAGFLVFSWVSAASAGIFEKPLEVQVMLPAGTSLAVGNLLGSIQVKGGGPAGSARIAARVVAEAGSQEEAAALLEGVAFVNDAGGDGASVRVTFPLDRATSFYPPRESEAARRVIGGWMDALAALVSETRVTYEDRDVRIGRSKGSVGLAVHLVVTIPDGSAASFDLEAGSIRVAQARGRIRAHVGHGRLLAEQVYGSLELVTERADATLRTFKGEGLRVETASGNVSLVDVDSDTAGITTGTGGCEATGLTGRSVTAATGEGDLYLGGMEAERYDLSTTSGNLTLITNLDRSPQGILKSGSGDVLVRVGRIAPFRMEIATTSGGIRAEGSSIKLTSTSKTAAVVERGTGGGQIRVETATGSVQVAQRS